VKPATPLEWAILIACGIAGWVLIFWKMGFTF
jgi:hypothetical protein